MSVNVHPGEYMNKGLLALLAILFTATVGATVYFTYTMLSLNRLSQDSTSDTTAVLALQKLLLDVRSAESGQRGYIITDADSYLKPYTSALTSIPIDLQMIRSQKSLAPYKKQIAQLTTYTNQKVAEMTNAVNVRKTQGFDAAAAAVDTNEGQKLMGEVTTEDHDIDNAVLAAITPEQDKTRTKLHRSIILSIVLDAFLLAMCGLILRYFHKTILRERAIESAKSEFLSLASHQLRTPATSVKQYLGMLDGGYFGKLNKGQKEALAIAYESNESEITIINNLLNVAKLSLEKIQLVMKPIIIADLIRQVADEYTARIKAANQKLTFKNSIKQRKAVIDGTYFKTVIENLVDNASKYSPEGARIDLRLKESVRPGYFVFTVSDTGVGIKKRDQDKLFKKFSRVQNAYSDTSEGSGLGLYWVKQIIERHHGTISVHSIEGKGTTFTVEVPLKQPK